jgi:hypothetical protein
LAPLFSKGDVFPEEVFMRAVSSWVRVALAITIAAGIVASAGATTLRRASLEDLVAGNRTVIVGEVRDSHSYWNEERTFILTDVRIAAKDVLKGNPRTRELTVTIMGGRVDDLTTLIVGGAELIPGRSYVLFLNEDDLPGVKAVPTVREHSQGVFEIVRARDGVRAISQAKGHPLVPDALGFVDPPGGEEGLLLDTMIQSIRKMADRPSRDREVQ